MIAGGIVNAEKEGKNYPGILGRRIRVQCFPLYSVLMALGNPTVHYFSLDIEGAELMGSEIMYSVDGVDVAQEMERNLAAARHSWARQNTWLLLSFSLFPVQHPLHPLSMLMDQKTL